MQGSSELLLAADSAAGPGDLVACKALLAQLPWEEIPDLELASIKGGVQKPLVQFLWKAAGQASSGDADADELMHTALTVRFIQYSVWVLPVQLSDHCTFEVP